MERAPDRNLRHARGSLLKKLVTLLWAACALAQTPDSREVFKEIGAITEELAKISGLKLRKPVPYDIITRDKVEEFLNKRIKEATTNEELRAEELVLKKFGLVPQDFDLKKTTIALMTEQAAAFYDYNAKKLFITDWTPNSTREGALAHELAHALADQHFNLGRYIKKGKQSDDGSTARMAVMEGQASWLMSEYLARKSGQSLKTSQALVDMMSRSSEGGGEFPVFDNAPLYMKESLIFPYTAGLRFQQAVVMKLGQAGFREVFKRAPDSTRQILHPETYLQRAKLSKVALPRLDKSVQGYKGLVEGMVGELDHAILIRQYAGKEQAADLSPHWRAGAFGLLENKAKDATILLYSVEWDGEDAARRYLQFYRVALGKKWKRIEVSAETADRIEGLGDDGKFTLERKGALVTVIEGLPSK